MLCRKHPFKYLTSEVYFKRVVRWIMKKSSQKPTTRTFREMEILTAFVLAMDQNPKMPNLMRNLCNPSLNLTQSSQYLILVTAIEPCDKIINLEM